MTDAERYARAELAMLSALAHMMDKGYKPTHAIAGLACALRSIGVPDGEVRASLAAVLLVSADGGMLEAQAAHVEIDRAHALMSAPIGQVSRGGDA